MHSQHGLMEPSAQRSTRFLTHVWWPRAGSGLFGAVYFVFSAAFDVASNVSSMSDYSVPTRLFIVLPVGILDAFFYWWGS